MQTEADNPSSPTRAPVNSPRVSQAPPQLKQGNLEGRDPDPQGGRVYTLSTKINAHEGKALADEKKRLETEIGRRMSDSEFKRYRLLVGGKPLQIDYPPLPVDNRRERRNSLPKTQGKLKKEKPVREAVAA